MKNHFIKQTEDSYAHIQSDDFKLPRTILTGSKREKQKMLTILMVNINIFPSSTEGTDREKVNNVKFLKNIITVLTKSTSWTFPEQHKSLPCESLLRAILGFIMSYKTGPHIF